MKACIILKGFRFWFCVLRAINHCSKKGKLYVSHTTQYGEREKKQTFEAFAYFSVIFHTPSDIIAESYDKQKGKREIIDQE